eukprot:5762025-Prymnesium_polylepis.1
MLRALGSAKKAAEMLRAPGAIFGSGTTGRGRAVATGKVEFFLFERASESASKSSCSFKACSAGSAGGSACAAATSQ